MAVVRLSQSLSQFGLDEDTLDDEFLQYQMQDDAEMPKDLRVYESEVESSRTHFDVLGLGLEASSPRKLPCSRLENSTIFEPWKCCWKTPEILQKICKNLFFRFLK